MQKNIRMRERDLKILELLKAAKAVKDDTDAIRRGLDLLATSKGISVPA